MMLPMEEVIKAFPVGSKFATATGALSHRVLGYSIDEQGRVVLLDENANGHLAANCTKLLDAMVVWLTSTTSFSLYTGDNGALKFRFTNNDATDKARGETWRYIERETLRALADGINEFIDENP